MKARYSVWMSIISVLFKVLGNRNHEALGTPSLAYAAGKHKDLFKEGGGTLSPKAVLWPLHVCGAMCVHICTWIYTCTCIQCTYHTYIANTHAYTQNIIKNYNVKGEARKLGNWKKTQWCEDTGSLPASLTHVCELCTWHQWSTGHEVQPTGPSAVWRR